MFSRVPDISRLCGFPRRLLSMQPLCNLPGGIQHWCHSVWLALQSCFPPLMYSHLAEAWSPLLSCLSLAIFPTTTSTGPCSCWVMDGCQQYWEISWPSSVYTKLTFLLGLRWTDSNSEHKFTSVYPLLYAALKLTQSTLWVSIQPWLSCKGISVIYLPICCVHANTLTFKQEMYWYISSVVILWGTVSYTWWALTSTIRVDHYLKLVTVGLEIKNEAGYCIDLGLFFMS